MPSGHVEHGNKPGPDPYLNDKEEAGLLHFYKDVLLWLWKDKM